MTPNNPGSLVKFLQNTLGRSRPKDYYQRIEEYCRERKLIEARVRDLAKQIAGSRLWRKRRYFANRIETELKPLVPEVKQIVNYLARKMAVRY